MLYQQYAAGEPVHDTSITLPANGSEPCLNKCIVW